MKPSSQFVFRPTLAPGHEIPIGVRGVGRRRFRPGEGQSVGLTHWVTMQWSVSGYGRIKFRDAELRMRPEMLAVYFPGDRQIFRAEETGDWEIRWCSLDGPMAAPIVEAMGFRHGIVYRDAPPPVKLFTELAGLARDITKAGELRAGAAAYRLITESAATARPGQAPAKTGDTGDFKAKAIRVMHTSWNDPAFGVEQLADMLGMHRSVLARRFRQAFGLSPSDYLHRWRIQNALARLKETDYAIQEIARDCGWGDQNYFARSIRQATGQTPSEFRRT